MRVRYSPRAFAEREAIFAYLDAHSPQGARNVKRAIVNAIRLLGSHPHMAPPTDIPSVRELSIPRWSYKVYYQIEQGEIWIIHIRDARRRPWQGGK
jgi:plasmid stabilization system protein ParE